MVKHTNLIYDCTFWGELHHKYTKDLWKLKMGAIREDVPISSISK